jgi:flagellar protein FlaF
MSLQAYQRAAEHAEGPKQTEYRLFGLVTRALMDAEQKDSSDHRGRMKALHWNRRLWTTLATDCANPENRLPMALRANIISLSIWVDKHTSDVMQKQAAIQPLIDINRTIMQGLSGQLASSPAAGAAPADGPAPLAQPA